MEKMLAYCGLICDECPAFTATRENDLETLAKLGEAWSGDDPAFAPEEMLCDGCLVADGRIFTWCRECELRNCAMERGVATCAHCPDYGCDKLQRVFAMPEIGLETKKRLEELRAAL
jgi:hypothetical protein